MKFKYKSKHNICGFKIKRYYDHSPNDLIVCFCFFRPEFERNGKFKTYIDCFTHVLENFHKVYPNWKLRLYIDTSIFSKKYKEERKMSKDILKKAFSYDYFQLAMFKHKNFYNKDLDDKNIIYHIKYFGTISRFIPLFDDSDSSCVAIRDIDTYLSLEDGEITNKYINSDNNYDSIEYNTIDRFAPYQTHTGFPTMETNVKLASMISTRKKMPKNILDTIITDSINKNPRLMDIYKDIQNRKTLVDNKSYSIFDYGYDEIILEEYISKYVNANFNCKIYKLLLGIRYSFFKYFTCRYDEKYGNTYKYYLCNDNSNISPYKLVSFYIKILGKDNYNFNLSPRANLSIQLVNIENDKEKTKIFLGNVKKYIKQFNRVLNFTDSGNNFIISICNEYLNYNNDEYLLFSNIHHPFINRVNY